MKPGDYYMDEHFEPYTVILRVSDLIGPDGHECTIVYTSNSYRMRLGEKVTRWSNDEELIPVVMLKIDGKVIPIKL